MVEKKTKPKLHIIILLLLSSILTNTGLSGNDYLSPSALAANAQTGKLYIACTTAKQIAVFDIPAGKIIKTYPLPDEPGGLALSRENSRLYVTSGGPEGTITEIDLQTGKIIKNTPAGHTPTAPVLSHDNKSLYVCNRFDNNVSVIDLVSYEQVAQIPVRREPVAAAITPDGKYLFVNNHLPAGAANKGNVSAVVSVINTTSNKLTTTIELSNGATTLQGICMSPDGRYAYAVHVLARYTLPTTQLERGWVNTNALSIIDIENKKLFETVLLDDVDYGAANPWAVSCTNDNKYVCVTHAGTDELSVIDVQALHDKINKYHADEKKNLNGSTGQYNYGTYSSGLKFSSNIPNELSFLYGIRQRIKLCGKGPRALAIIGSNIYIAEYFTDSLSSVDLNKTASNKTAALPLGSPPELTSIRQGEILFNDASICFQHWQSCASCHPGNARVDALNWDLLNDGLGNPKNTKSLLLSHRTSPSMMTGVRSNAEEAVRAGIKHILFAVCTERQAVSIDEYLKFLKPIPGPYLVKGKLGTSAKRGQKLFNSAGCSFCHKGKLFTDQNPYDVGIGDGRDKGKKFDTPTLIETWRTAPYLYDGRAATIKEVITKFNPEDKHGKTSNLTDMEIEDLTNFILSQ
ncbi:MAG: c-type cytochrome [Sedimentisphaerales bacterium]|nr:c-type cytochrome [Sedimentisphaerales bacterium]